MDSFGISFFFKQRKIYNINLAMKKKNLGFMENWTALHS